MNTSETYDISEIDVSQLLGLHIFTQNDFVNDNDYEMVGYGKKLNIIMMMLFVLVKYNMIVLYGY